MREALEAAHRRITKLEAVLRAVSATALASISEAAPAAPPRLPPLEEVPVSTGPSVELAHNDTLGEGRWV